MPKAVERTKERKKYKQAETCIGEGGRKKITTNSTATATVIISTKVQKSSIGKLIQ